MLPMLKVCAKGFDLARMIVLAATLLLIPFSASAGGLGHHAATPATQAAANHQADAAKDSVSGLNSTPAETPLHCHQKSPAPQVAAPALASVSPDHPPTVIAITPGHSKDAISPLNLCAPRTPIAGPPRFILFGNFRS